jgi:hypothetical protein
MLDEGGAAGAASHNLATPTLTEAEVASHNSGPGSACDWWVVLGHGQERKVYDAGRFFSDHPELDVQVGSDGGGSGGGGGSGVGGGGDGGGGTSSDSNSKECVEQATTCSRRFLHWAKLLEVLLQCTKTVAGKNAILGEPELASHLLGLLRDSDSVSYHRHRYRSTVQLCVLRALAHIPLAPSDTSSKREPSANDMGMPGLGFVRTLLDAIGEPFVLLPPPSNNRFVETAPPNPFAAPPPGIAAGGEEGSIAVSYQRVCLLLELSRRPDWVPAISEAIRLALSHLPTIVRRLTQPPQVGADDDGGGSDGGDGGGNAKQQLSQCLGSLCLLGGYYEGLLCCGTRALARAATAAAGSGDACTVLSTATDCGDQAWRKPRTLTSSFAETRKYNGVMFSVAARGEKIVCVKTLALTCNTTRLSVFTSDGQWKEQCDDKSKWAELTLLPVESADRGQKLLRFAPPLLVPPGKTVSIYIHARDGRVSFKAHSKGQTDDDNIAVLPGTWSESSRPFREGGDERANIERGHDCAYCGSLTYGLTTNGAPVVVSMDYDYGQVRDVGAGDLDPLPLEPPTLLLERLCCDRSGNEREREQEQGQGQGQGQGQSGDTTSVRALGAIHQIRDAFSDCFAAIEHHSGNGSGHDKRQMQLFDLASRSMKALHSLTALNQHCALIFAPLLPLLVSQAQRTVAVQPASSTGPALAADATPGAPISTVSDVLQTAELVCAASIQRLLERKFIDGMCEKPEARAGDKTRQAMQTTDSAFHAYASSQSLVWGDPALTQDLPSTHDPAALAPYLPASEVWPREFRVNEDTVQRDKSQVGGLRLRMEDLAVGMTLVFTGGAGIGSPQSVRVLSLNPGCGEVTVAPTEKAVERVKLEPRTMESKHNYEPNTNECLHVSLPRAVSMSVVFNRQSKTERRRDYVRFWADKARTTPLTGELSGDENWPGTSSHPPVKINGGECWMEWKTDGGKCICTFEVFACVLIDTFKFVTTRLILIVWTFDRYRILGLEDNNLGGRGEVSRQTADHFVQSR